MPTPLPLTARRIRHNSGTDLAMHTHAEGQLLLLEQGTLSIACEQGWWLVPPGQAIWIPAGMPHKASYSEASSLLRLMMREGIYPGLPASCLVFSCSALLVVLVQEACRFGLAERTSGDEELIAALIAHQLGLPVARPQYFLPGGHSRRLQQVTDYLRHNPASRETLEQLALLAHCSSRTLARLFENETGMCFSRWREQLHLNCAMDALARGQSVTSTALKLGYLSPSSFSTMFTRACGMPPSHFVHSLDKNTASQI